MVSLSTSPLDLLEQRELCTRLNSEQQTAAAALKEVQGLPEGRGIYTKRLNLFYRTPKPAAQAAAKSDLATKTQEAKEAQGKFEEMRKKVEDERSHRRTHLTQMAAAAASQARGGGDVESAPGGDEDDDLFEGFGQGERVQVMGLKSSTEVNGCYGTVQGYSDGRFAVLLDGRPKPVRIKPENLAAAGAGWGGSEKAFTGVVRER